MENKKFDFDESDKREWRELGFYYDIDEAKKEWQLSGNKRGIKKFTEKLIEYAKYPKNGGKSEHIHLGPYQYLKLITWTEPMIDSQGIYGTIADINRLANIILSKINSSIIDEEFVIDEEYSINNEYKIRVRIMNDDFDPSSLDNAD